ncbi:uncharacterized protein BO87DRAFT_374932 [Aspergillus neoniger CBS 115656]|uniref:Uncharacterized protein n=1 Tax=Aspergillus neoniger (strain CBS 115656) TaxID=1448310 RepID=A0A318YVG9_ASPNB|nr:hypothetical protein BO87DRAFT_374932 [Aspergillus neoniger CBS 115656]PYH35920.1 hypothetical protein BO87DRAFT_374932 [Aspergillus neoniger CBS 115656]
MEDGLSRQSISDDPVINGISAPYNILADLPPSYQLRSYQSCSTSKRLQTALKAIYTELEQNGGDGNQWLVLMGMPQTTIDRLSEADDILPDIGVRFMWEANTGLFKVVPSASHDFTTTEIMRYIEDQRAQMGIPRTEVSWGATTTNPGTVSTHGKQPDHSFYPSSRPPSFGQLSGWPTLVFETGVSESMAKLRRDATWWFQNSSGDTRIVLIVSIKSRSREVRLEKWQLAPPNIGRPGTTRQLIDQLRQQPDQMPPLVQQPANMQLAFSIQEVVITPTSIIGQPLVIPFRAMFDRQPTGAERDIVIDNVGFREISRFI